jgi:hypothetical protein
MKILKSFLVTIFLFSLQVDLLFAQTIGGSSLDGRFDGWLKSILVAIIGIAGIVAAAVLVFNAILYVTAGGDDGKIQKATKGITYAVVGLVVVSIAFLIVNFVIEQL